MPARATHTRRAILPVLLVAVAACRAGGPAASVSVVDFIREFDRAERRPPSFTVANFTAAGVALPAIVGPAPGRLTWTLPLPHGGELRARIAAVAAPVHVRIGVSDNRVYETVAAALVQPGAPWTPITVDLSRYAGWKPSLFYRPDRAQWHVVLSSDAVNGAATIAWGLPGLVATPTAAREYAARRAALTRSGAP